MNVAQDDYIESLLAHEPWPLAGGDVVVLLLNIGNGTKKITASWDDIGLKSGVSATATDLWTGENLTAVGSISASVASHDSAVYRLVQG